MLCPHYKSCKWFTLSTIQKIDECEHYFLNTKDKPFCGHFPKTFKTDFPPIDISEYYDPQTYTKERTAPRSDIPVVVRKLIDPTEKEIPPPKVKKERKPKVKKEDKKSKLEKAKENAKKYINKSKKK